MGIVVCCGSSVSNVVLVAMVVNVICFSVVSDFVIETVFCSPTVVADPFDVDESAFVVSATLSVDTMVVNVDVIGNLGFVTKRNLKMLID